MEDFIHRTITFNSGEKLYTEDGDPIKISISRTVTSLGLSTVTASYANQSIKFDAGASVEHAREFAKQILIACDYDCKLPSVS